MNKGIIVSLVLLIMGATATKAQFAQPDMDDKYATELVKAGTTAPDFKDYPIVKICKGQDSSTRFLGFMVPGLS